MSKYDEALRLFVPNNDMREWMNNPFSIGEKSIATDGMFIAVVDAILSKRYPQVQGSIEKMVSNVLPKEKNMDLLVDIKNLDIIISKIPMVDKSIEESADCEACDGEGEVDADFYHNHKHYSIEAECPVCDGRGYILQNSEKKLVRDPEFLVKIKECWFKVGKIEQLLKACRLFDLKYINLIYQKDPHKPSVFQVAEMQVLLMPMSQFEGQNTNKIIEPELLVSAEFP